MSSSIGDDRTSYLPPHELRALGANLVDREDTRLPGPSIATTSSPGLATAAASPTAHGVPAFSADDPSTLAIALSRVIGEPLMPMSLIPIPAPERAMSEFGLAGAPISPGISPEIAAATPAGALGRDPFSPSLEPAPAAPAAAAASHAPSDGGRSGGSGVPSSLAPVSSSAGSPASVGSSSYGGGASNAHGAPTYPTSHSSAPYGGGASNAHGAPAYPTSHSSASMPGAPGTLAGTPSPTGLPTASIPAAVPPLAAPTHASSNPGDALHVMGSQVRVPFMPGGNPMKAPDLASHGSSVEHIPLFDADPSSFTRLASMQPGTTSIPFVDHVDGNPGHGTPTGLGSGTPTAGGVPMYGATSSPPGAVTGAPTGFGHGAPTSVGHGTHVGAPSSQRYGNAPTSGAHGTHVGAPSGNRYGNAPTSGAHGTNVGAPTGYVSQQPTTYAGGPAGLSRGALGGGSPPDSVIRQAGGVAFDPYLVRRDFPILEERVHGGKRLVWLDNAATTQKPRAVIDRLSYYYEHENSNVHRAAHTMAARATEAFESARESTRKFLNAPSAQEIIFVRGATEGINLIAKSLGKRKLERGDEIVLTHLEHHANIVPWQQLCAETGAKLRVAPVDDRGDVILEAYERLLCSRTKIVSFTQVSNALGTITPAKEMIASAHRWGATVILDGAQAVSHMAVDVQELDCDFYVFSGHKVFAPTGIGAVFGKRAVLEDMPPWQSGGNMIADVTFEKTVYQPPPWRFEAGTGNIADAAGLGAALEYVMRIGMHTIDRYEHSLLEYAHERLAVVPGLHWIGTPRNKAGVLSFVLDGQRTEDVGSALDKYGIAVRSGHHCAQPILRRFGVEASVRASLAFYNVREDIDALTEALLRLQSASV